MLVPRTFRFRATSARRWFTLVAALGLGPTALGAQRSEPPRVVFPQELQARVNGVGLNYLDWGGTGDLMLLLPGWSHTAHAWAGIAPAFTDRYRVVGLTRRGHGSSEKPIAGFTLEALVDDIVAFIGALGAQRVVLVGHSFAGREMPLVAERLGSRVAGMIFLDAVYDWPMMGRNPGTADINRLMLPPDSVFGSYAALEAWYRWRDPETWGPVAAVTLRAQTHLAADGRLAWQLPLAELGKQLGWMATTGTDYAAIKVPVLAVWARMLEPALRAMRATGYSAEDQALFRRWVTEVDVPVKQSGLAALRRAAGPVTVVELESPHLLTWYDPVRIIAEMDRFLGSLPAPSGR